MSYKLTVNMTDTKRGMSNTFTVVNPPKDAFQAAADAARERVQHGDTVERMELVDLLGMAPDASANAIMDKVASLMREPKLCDGHVGVSADAIRALSTAALAMPGMSATGVVNTAVNVLKRQTVSVDHCTVPLAKMEALAVAAGYGVARAPWSKVVDDAVKLIGTLKQHTQPTQQAAAPSENWHAVQPSQQVMPAMPAMPGQTAPPSQILSDAFAELRGGLTGAMFSTQFVDYAKDVRAIMLRADELTKDGYTNSGYNAVSHAVSNYRYKWGNIA